MNFRIFGPEDQKTKLEKNAPKSTPNRSVQALVPRQLQMVFEKLSSPFSRNTRTGSTNLQEGAK